MHGVMDYAQATTLLLGPSALGLNKKGTNIYRGMAVNLLTYNALTDYLAGITPVMALETTRKLILQTCFCIRLFLTKSRKKKKALLFHAGVTVMAESDVFLTCWKAISGLDDL